MKKFLEGVKVSWSDLEELPAVNFKCGRCGNIVSSDKGYQRGTSQRW